MANCLKEATTLGPKTGWIPEYPDLHLCHTFHPQGYLSNASTKNGYALSKALTGILILYFALKHGGAFKTYESVILRANRVCDICMNRVRISVVLFVSKYIHLCRKK